MSTSRTPTPESASPQLTVIVPTRNEAQNIQPLLDRLANSLAGGVTRVLFVDDSDDATPAVIDSEAGRRRPGLLVEQIHRVGSDRSGGLGGAVVAGLQRSDTEWVCVMDGDLQHPPECIPGLLEAARRTPADLVVASRYVAGGSNEGLGATRALVSIGSTVLAKAVFPHRLRGIRDPMSGFFLLRRHAVARALHPRGFKILLEIAVRHPELSRCEVPFVFVERTAGASKGTLREGVRFLRLLLEMRLSLLRAQRVTTPRARQRLAA
jgi:dolichol-phosphate mannosyltransferase